MGTEASRPLSALLSQVLVAFTLELDNEFERRMIEAGEPGTLSVGVWASLMRFLSDGPVSIRGLAACALDGSTYREATEGLDLTQRRSFVAKRGLQPMDVQQQR